MSTRSRLLTRLAHRLDGARILGGVCALGLLTTSSCTGGGTSDTAPTATASDGNRGTRVADFVNGGFESSSTSFAPWTVTTMLNTNGITNFPPVVYADLGLLTGGNAPSSVVSPTTTGAPVPLGLVAADSLKYPFTGSNALLLNAEGETKNASVIEQSLTVAATDVDPADGVVHVRFAAAGVVEASTHTGTQQPYIFLELVNTTTGASLFHTFNYSNMPGVTWNTSASPTATVYTNWKAFDIAPGSGGIRLGDTLHARIVASGCQPGGHWGEIYLDQFGTTFPVPDVVVSAPAYATAGSALTYTVTAKNGGNGPATGTVVHFTLPTEADSTVAAPKSLPTTFASYSAPNATCVVGTGTPVVVTCTIGALSPGASNTFTVTVNLPTALQETTAGFSGTVNVNEGTYDVVTAQNTTPLSGGVVQTQIAALLTTPVDLSTSLTDGVPSLLWGSNDTYTYTVQNKSAASITGSTVTDTAPTTFAVSSWSCAASTGSTCGTASGTTGAINATTGTIAANGTLTYTVKGKWTGTGTSNQTYTMTATPPAG